MFGGKLGKQPGLTDEEVYKWIDESDFVCTNCGDRFDGPERDCPNPSPGEPYKDCGRGGHMFRAPGRPEVRVETVTMADPDSEWRKNPRLRAGYGALADVLDKALNQAQFGKGNDRHNQNEERFEDQQIVQLGEWMGRSTVFGIGQACKKAIESTHLSDEKAIEELLGAINYLAAAVIVIQRRKR